MLYKRSSFVHFLVKKRDCETKVIGKNSEILIISNGMMSHRMWMDRHDRIDYEEIWAVCTNLQIVGLPGDTDLKRIE